MIGLPTLLDMESLPLLRTDARVYCVGSCDKLGGNADWDWWLYQDTQTGEWVLCEVDGPGCLWNFVVHHAVGRSDPLYRFYFDGEIRPRFEIRHSEFGVKPPFVVPLADRFQPDVSRDERLAKIDFRIVRSFCPMPFARGLRITSSVKLEGNESKGGGWGHAICHTYPTAEGVVTFTGREDYTRLTDLWRHCGQDPKPAEGNIVTPFAVRLQPGESRQVFARDGAGSLTALRMRLPAADPAVLGTLWLRLTWDGEPVPAVECPLGAFFGNELGFHPVRTLMLGTDEGGILYSFWPMPFWRSARVEVALRGGPGAAACEVAGEIAFKPESARGYPRNCCGHFRASAYQPPTAVPPQRDSHVALLRGRGHMVAGVVTSDRSFCEGDVRVHVDGGGSPAVQSDGSESWICYGWGFPQPPQSNPVSSYDGRGNETWSMLRLLLGDTYLFHSGLRMTVENGTGCRQGDAPDLRSGIVFWYGEPEPGMALTDFVDIGDANSERAHGYAAPGSTVYRLTSSLEGEFDDVSIADQGRALRGASEFTVQLAPENGGVILRCRSDQARQGQRAAVFVDDARVGERTWYRADRNPHRRWLEDEFAIPAAFTRGKRRIRVRIEPVASPSAEAHWNESFYWIFCLGSGEVSAARPTRLPAKALPAWERMDGTDKGES